MSEDDRSKWEGQGMLDRIRFVAEMEMYHGSGGAVAQVLGQDFSPQLTAQDVKEMKEREDTARRIAACTFLEIIKQKKERKKQDAVIVSPADAKKLPSVVPSTAISADIATIATPISSNTSGGPKIFGDTTAPALIELSSDSSFSDEDPDEAFI